jgi:hypothetical protein
LSKDISVDSDSQELRGMVEDFFNEKNYNDLLVEFDHWDGFTKQVFVTAVGEWTDLRRKELQERLKAFNRRVLVSTVEYGGKEKR